MIIDCHVHVNQYELMQNIPLLDDRIAELQKEMISNNVDYAVILSHIKQIQRDHQQNRSLMPSKNTITLVWLQDSQLTIILMKI